MSVVAAVAAGVLLLAACGDASNRSSDPGEHGAGTGTATGTVVDGVQQVRIEAGDNLRFSPSTITVHPGKVTITLVNTGKGAPHNLQLPGLPVADWVPLTSAGDSASATFTTPAPGTYTFVCSIHQRQGQTGQLIVLPN